MKNLKEKMLQWQLKKLKKKKGKNNFIDFKKELSEARKMLVIIPEYKIDLTNFNSFLSNFKQAFPRVNSYYLKSEESIAENVEKNAQIFTFTKNDSNFLNLVKKEFISKLQRENFNIIFDLNTESQFLSSYILLNLDTPIKITFYDKDPFSNSTLSIKSRLLEPEIKTYETLIKYLKILNSS